MEVTKRALYSVELAIKLREEEVEWLKRILDLAHERIRTINDNGLKVKNVKEKLHMIKTISAALGKGEPNEEI